MARRLIIPAYAGRVQSLLEPSVRHWDFPRGVRGVVVLLEHGKAHGLTVRSLLAGTALSAGDLTDPQREVTAGQELRVVRNLLRQGAGAALSPVVLGRRYRLETFGIAGYALVTSPTLVDAMNVALRYMDLTFTFSIPHAHVEQRPDGDAVVIEAYDDALPGDVRDFLVARDLVAVESVLRELFLGALPTSYDAAQARVTFPATFLAAALPRANPAAQAIAEEVCAALTGRRRGESPLVQQVRILLAQRIAVDPSASGVAATLALGERTLRRRLAEDGTSFQVLLDEVRVALADALLGAGTLSVDEVAVRLGYAEAASFIHAHRRWHGTTPGRRVRTC
jgi:AraC-like DNA-binding protein